MRHSGERGRWAAAAGAGSASTVSPGRATGTYACARDKATHRDGIWIREESLTGRRGSGPWYPRGLTPARTCTRVALPLVGRGGLLEWRHTATKLRAYTIRYDTWGYAFRSLLPREGVALSSALRYPYVLFGLAGAPGFGVPSPVSSLKAKTRNLTITTCTEARAARPAYVIRSSL